MVEIERFKTSPYLPLLLFGSEQLSARLSEAYICIKPQGQMP